MGDFRGMKAKTIITLALFLAWLVVNLLWAPSAIWPVVVMLILCGIVVIALHHEEDDTPDLPPMPLPTGHRRWHRTRLGFMRLFEWNAEKGAWSRVRR